MGLAKHQRRGFSGLVEAFPLLTREASLLTLSFEGEFRTGDLGLGLRRDGACIAIVDGEENFTAIEEATLHESF